MLGSRARLGIRSIGARRLLPLCAVPGIFVGTSTAFATATVVYNVQVHAYPEYLVGRQRVLGHNVSTSITNEEMKSIVAGALDRDGKSQAALIARYQDRVLAQIVGMVTARLRAKGVPHEYWDRVVTEEMAKEVSQDVWLKIFKGLPTFYQQNQNEPAFNRALNSWVDGTARNEAFHYVQLWKHRPALLETNLAEARNVAVPGTLDGWLEASEQYYAVVKLLKLVKKFLPDNSGFFIRSFLYPYTHKQLASFRSSTPDQARRYTTRLRQRVKEFVDDELVHALIDRERLEGDDPTIFDRYLPEFYGEVDAETPVVSPSPETERSHLTSTPARRAGPEIEQAYLQAQEERDRVQTSLTIAIAQRKTLREEIEAVRAGRGQGDLDELTKQEKTAQENVVILDGDLKRARETFLGLAAQIPGEEEWRNLGQRIEFGGKLSSSELQRHLHDEWRLADGTIVRLLSSDDYTNSEQVSIRVVLGVAQRPEVDESAYQKVRGNTEEEQLELFERTKRMEALVYDLDPISGTYAPWAAFTSHNLSGVEIQNDPYSWLLSNIPEQQGRLRIARMFHNHPGGSAPSLPDRVTGQNYANYISALFERPTPVEMNVIIEDRGETGEDTTRWARR